MLKGRGWVKERICGCQGKSRQWQYVDLKALSDQLLEDSVLTRAIENFGRFDAASRLVVISVALALYDADLRYAKGEKQDIGILGTSPDGALVSNRAYFKDYVQAGRKLGRGNLFVYTLPSSPLAEAAIHFGLQGPLLYMHYPERSEENLLTYAQLLIESKATPKVLAIVFNSGEAVCSLV